MRLSCSALDNELRDARLHFDDYLCPLCKRCASPAETCTMCPETAGAIVELATNLVTLGYDCRWLENPYFTPNEKLSTILDESKWNPDANAFINQWCERVDKISRKGIVTKNTPGLAKLIDLSSENPLHENICGTIIDFKEGVFVHRVKVTDYDPLAQTHTLSGENLDVEGDHWVFREGVDLNAALEQNQVSLLTEKELFFSADVLEKVEPILNSNVIGRSLKLKINRRFRTIIVEKYDTSTELHECSCNGNQIKANLNYALEHKQLKMKQHMKVLEHLVVSRIPPNSGSSASMPARVDDAERSVK